MENLKARLLNMQVKHDPDIQGDDLKMALNFRRS